MSLRQIAKQLGITPAYLSYMLNGKRPWRRDLFERYSYLVNTSVNTQGIDANNIAKSDGSKTTTQPSYDSATTGAGGSRTPRGHRGAPTNGFEVREAHQSPSTPETRPSRLGEIPWSQSRSRGYSEMVPYRAESRRFLITALGTAPTTWSTGLPPLNTSSVGMLLMPYFIAV